MKSALQNESKSGANTADVIPDGVNDTVDLAVFAGQSNMSGRGNAQDAVLCDKFAGFEYKAISNPKTLVPITEPFGLGEDKPDFLYDYDDSKVTKRTGSMVSAVVDEYYRQTRRQLVAVSASMGGTSTDDWISTYIYDAVGRLDDAKAFLDRNNISVGRIFVVWCQGETDGDNGTDADTYIKNTRRLFDSFKAHGAKQCFLVQIGHYNYADYPDNRETKYAVIRSAQTKLCHDNEDVIMAGSFEKYIGGMKDRYHYSQSAYNAVGETAGKSIAAYFNQGNDMEKRTFYVTKSVQEAVNECAKAGGGTVVVTKGEHRTKAIHLKSNVNLHLNDGAVLIFSGNPDDYIPPVFTRWEGTECYNYSPLIYARNCENVSVTGAGTLMGNGEMWWDWKDKQQAAADKLNAMAYDNVPVEKRVFATPDAALRPQFIQFINCKNVLLRDFTVCDGPQWTIHPVYCENVTVQNVTVSTHGHNTDGINPDSCRNVLIENCTLDTGDDCIAINSGINEDGWRINRPCENVEIRNCKMLGGHGAIVIGSAVSGGVKNVYAHDCKIDGTMQGIRLKSMRGRGGGIDGARFENIEISDVSNQAIQINMFYEFSTVVPKTNVPSDFKNISMENISVKRAECGIQIKGLPEHKLKNITLENIDITAKNAFECDNVESIKMKNITIKTEVKNDKTV